MAEAQSKARSDDALAGIGGVPGRTEEFLPQAGIVTWRSIIIGLILIPLNTYWIMEVEGIWHSGHPTAMSIMWNVVFNIFVLVLINLAIKRFAPRYALTQSEFIIIYVMLSLASALAGHDTLQLGIPAMTHGWWFATEENKWASLFHRFLPKWLTVSDIEVIRPYYEGASTFYKKYIVMAWLGPVLWWCAFILAMGMVMVAICVFLRKQWTENEKLSFPLVELPLAITSRGGSSALFTNRMLWLGFGLGAAINMLNGLHALIPALPYLALRHDEYDLGRYFTQPPWNAIGWTPLPLYPFIVGLGYLLPVDLSFSLWFFYIFSKIQLIVTAAAGVRDYAPRMPYFSEQTYGAWLAIFIFAMYTARRHLKQVLFKILGLPSELDDKNEPLTYRQAALAFVLGMAFIVYFCLRANMSLAFIAVYFLMYFILAIGIIRVRAELGPPAHEMAGMNVPMIMVDFVGTQALGGQNLTMVPLFYWFTGRGYRTQPWPYQLEAMKMAERTGMNYRGMGIAMGLALFFGALATYWATLHLHYKVGATGNGLVMHAWGQWNELASRLETPQRPDPMAMAFVGIGFLFTCFLTYMRTYFVWWPFHPAGYAISTNFGAEYFWSAILIAWLIKTLVLRYGGYKLYRQLLPVMFGLVLGQYCTGAFWSVTSVILQQRTYDFAPG